MLGQNKYLIEEENSLGMILKLIEDCKNELNKKKKIEILIEIDSLLLRSDQIDVSSLLTVKEINSALDRIEGKLLLL
ncbi:MAG TPA: hypothetical protein VE089_08525 [Nitrososphaeraceae archaeon]|jgi:hypothetical protein|nr:hypothetical protein [Nitrososphaeraceae archaeon]